MSSTKRDPSNAPPPAVKQGIFIGVVLLILIAPFIIMGVIIGYVLWPFEAIASRSYKALMGIGKRLVDPVFGPVTYQGSSLWHAERNLDALGGRLVVAVPGARATGPNHAYGDLLRGIAERQNEIARQAETSIFREYQALAPTLRKEFAAARAWLAESSREAVPILEQPSQIWTLLSEGCITLEEDAEQPGSFSIGWQCTWGIEYGDVNRSFVNWTLEEPTDE